MEKNIMDLDSLFFKKADEFFIDNLPNGLTFDDVSLATCYSDILPRQTNLQTSISDRLTLSLPIISSDMDTVTEYKMAISMARNGGIGLIHYNMSADEQLRQVSKVKNNIHGLIHDPITVSPNDKIGDVLNLIEQNKFAFRTFPVVDEEGVLQGLLAGRVVKRRYAAKSVAEAMTPRQSVFTINQEDLGIDPIAAADKFFNDHMGIHKLLVVNKMGKLCGLFTLSDIERIEEEQKAYFKSSRDSKFRLRCGAAIPIWRNTSGEIDEKRIVEHIGSLVDVGLDVAAVSTAHGSTKGVGQMVKIVRDNFKDLSIIAGNVTNGEGVEFLSKMGADAIKVGQGPGSICSTRIVAGVGIPQLTAIYVCSKAAQKTGSRIIADGGITKSGDIVKALTLADCVLCGGILAGCPEASGSIIEIGGKLYKQYRGMGSLAAMKAGSAARYGHSISDKTSKISAEGVEALKEVSAGIDSILSQLAGGLQSGMGYLGANNLQELRQKARYIRVSPAGQKESVPHDVIEVKSGK